MASCWPSKISMGAQASSILISWLFFFSSLILSSVSTPFNTRTCYVTWILSHFQSSPSARIFYYVKKLIVEIEIFTMNLINRAFHSLWTAFRLYLYYIKSSVCLFVLFHKLLLSMTTWLYLFSSFINYYLLFLIHLSQVLVGTPSWRTTVH